MTITSRSIFNLTCIDKTLKTYDQENYAPKKKSSPLSFGIEHAIDKCLEKII